MFPQFMTVVLVVWFQLSAIVAGCGTTTHIEIGHRATAYFEDKTGGIDYKKLILANQDAFQAGNPYPDAFYTNLCKSGQFHSVSEDSHWVPFLNATINYVRRVYPQPWNKETEKLVVFMLGFVSHQVADVSWHSLGIDQGFLTTMGDVNFFGSFDKAHSVGDIGGDIVSVFEFDLSYIDILSDWYVPTKDLVQIYKEFYGRDIVDASLIEECTALLYLERLGEKLGIGKLFPHYAKKSPFMVEQFQSYFLGGLDDMATWTSNVWHEAIYMLNHGTSSCSLPRNPIYINCRNSTKPVKDSTSGKNDITGLHVNVDLYGLTLDLLQRRQTGRGVYLSPSENLKVKLNGLLNKRRKKMKKLKEFGKPKSSSSSYLRSTMTTSNAYAHLGWSLSTGDVNADGIDDLIIGAPGYSFPGNPQNGAIFIVFGRNEGQLPQLLDLDKQANVTLHGTNSKNGHFGTAVALLDMNQDGVEDLAVSAPSSGSASLNYTGAVHIYLAKSPGQFGSTPNVTVICKSRYCNLGWSIATADLNQDGFHDLIIGSPFVANGSQSQSGALWVVYSSKKISVKTEISVEDDATLLLKGDQQYGWLGYSVLTQPKLKGQGSWVLVSQPTYRLCANSQCSFSTNDVQSVGRLFVYNSLNMTKPVKILTGKVAFGKLSSSFAIGDPYNNGQELIGVGSDTMDVHGSIVDLPVTFTQAGNVNLFNMQSSQQEKRHKNHFGKFRRYFEESADEPPVSVFEGDRGLERFGQSLLLKDVTGDKIDDVIIGAPLRINDLTEEFFGGEQGAVFIFKGGASLPRGNVTRGCNRLDHNIEPCPIDKAFAVLSNEESGSRFGHQLAVWQTGTTQNLVISAPRSNIRSRLSGAIFIYSGFNK